MPHVYKVLNFATPTCKYLVNFWVSYTTKNIHDLVSLVHILSKVSHWVSVYNRDILEHLIDTYMFFGKRVSFPRVVKTLLQPSNITDCWSHKHVIVDISLNLCGLSSPPSLYCFAWFRSHISQWLSAEMNRHFGDQEFGCQVLLTLTNLTLRTGLEDWRTLFWKDGFSQNLYS